MTINNDQNKKYKISVEQKLGRGLHCITTVEVKNIEELKRHLKENDQAFDVVLVAMSMFDDSFLTYNMKSVDHLTHSDLVWLAEEDKYTARYIRE